tara:strand:+ start:8969 stop:9349 length:381 start_codon:yes stop_codon:yes gene_type:complete
MKKNFITISKSAQAYFKHLIEAQEKEDIGIRIYIDKPGSKNASLCLAFCPDNKDRSIDIILQYESLMVYIGKSSKSYLKGAEVNFVGDYKTGHITLKLPEKKIQDDADTQALDNFSEQYRQGLFKR